MSHHMIFTDEELAEIYDALEDSKDHVVGKQLWDGVHKYEWETPEQWRQKKAALENRRNLINDIREKIRHYRRDLKRMQSRPA